MSFEEQLQKLTERQQALTETVELMAAMQRDNQERFAKHEERFDRIADMLERLTAIVESHERRLSDLEEGAGS